MANVGIAMGKKIKELRKEKGLNQTDFGKLFHLSQNDVTNIENGKKTVSYEVLIDIANYFNVSTDYLIKENGIRADNPTLQFICDYTRLSDESIAYLHNPITNLLEAESKYKESEDEHTDLFISKYNEKLNKLLSNPIFYELLLDISMLEILEKQASQCYMMIDETISEDSLLSLREVLTVLKSKLFDIDISVNYLFKDDIYKNANELCLKHSDLLIAKKGLELKEMLKDIDINSFLGDDNE